MAEIARLVRRFREVYAEGRRKYTALFLAHWFLHRILDIGALISGRPSQPPRRLSRPIGAILTRIDAALISIERDRGIAEPWTMSSRHRFTIADNREWWNRHDWSNAGEEWTPNPEWKAAIVDRFLRRYVPPRGTAIEIGPGAGRWTEFLADRCAVVFAIDVSERALDLCRTRLSARGNVKFLLTDAPRIEVADAMGDAIWSYDVFVHVNPSDTRRYFQEFRRVLKPGGYLVIHHPGAPPPDDRVRPGTRSDLTDRMVLAFGRENGFELVEETRELVNPGDVLSVFRKAR